VNFPLFWGVNAGKWRQEKRTGIFGHQSSTFSHSPQTFSGSYRKYGEILQALATGDVLLPKPFLHLGRRLCRQMDIAGLWDFFLFSKDVKVQGGRVGAVRWWPTPRNGFGSRTSPAARFSKISSYLWQVPEQVWGLCGKVEDWCPNISVCFSCLHLPAFTPPKNRVTCFLTYPHITFHIHET
jgi:hypothetical protein